jgi:hypothetical protein
MERQDSATALATSHTCTVSGILTISRTLGSRRVVVGKKVVRAAYGFSRLVR